jgi:hypothetical protein
MIMCDGSEGQQAPTAAGADASMVAWVAGPGFITPELALGMVAAAAIVPSTDVNTSKKEIAGQAALCANVTGIKDPRLLTNCWRTSRSASPNPACWRFGA